jgi:hypothetical protein
MASPMVESRIEPHKKAHFTLHISDRIANDDPSLGSYSSVKCRVALSVSTLPRWLTTARQPQACSDLRFSHHDTQILVQQCLQPEAGRQDSLG